MCKNDLCVSHGVQSTHKLRLTKNIFCVQLFKMYKQIVKCTCSDSLAFMNHFFLTLISRNVCCLEGQVENSDILTFRLFPNNKIACRPLIWLLSKKHILMWKVLMSCGFNFLLLWSCLNICGTESKKILLASKRNRIRVCQVTWAHPSINLLIKF